MFAHVCHGGILQLVSWDLKKRIIIVVWKKCNTNLKTIFELCWIQSEFLLQLVVFGNGYTSFLETKFQLTYHSNKHWLQTFFMWYPLSPVWTSDKEKFKVESISMYPETCKNELIPLFWGNITPTRRQTMSVLNSVWTISSAGKITWRRVDFAPWNNISCHAVKKHWLQTFSMRFLLSPAWTSVKANFKDPDPKLANSFGHITNRIFNSLSTYLTLGSCINDHEFTSCPLLFLSTFKLSRNRIDWEYSRSISLTSLRRDLAVSE